jgi:hypothetical protein
MAEGVDGVKVLDKVEHVIETGERDIAELIGEFGGLLRSLRVSEAKGHTKAAVHGGEFDSTVHVTTSVERKLTPPQGPATATDATVTPETPKE